MEGDTVDKRERQDVVVEMRQQGHPYRAIAEATGVSSTTVAHDAAALTRAGRLLQPTVVRCSDGTEQPAVRLRQPEQLIPDRCGDCGEPRRGGWIGHIPGCGRPWL